MIDFESKAVFFHQVQKIRAPNMEAEASWIINLNALLVSLLPIFAPHKKMFLQNIECKV